MNVEHMESDEICRALMSWATRFAEKRRGVEPPPGTMPSSWLTEKNVIDAAEAWVADRDDGTALIGSVKALRAVRAARSATTRSGMMEQETGAVAQLDRAPTPRDSASKTELRSEVAGSNPASPVSSPTPRGALPTREPSVDALEQAFWSRGWIRPDSREAAVDAQSIIQSYFDCEELARLRKVDQVYKEWLVSHDASAIFDSMSAKVTALAASRQEYLEVVETCGGYVAKLEAMERSRDDWKARSESLDRQGADVAKQRDAARARAQIAEANRDEFAADSNALRLRVERLVQAAPPSSADAAPIPYTVTQAPQPTPYTGDRSQPYTIDRSAADAAPRLVKCPCRKCREANPMPYEKSLGMGPMGMILCKTCGNKRCPHATDHERACTDSNEPGQAGSVYGGLAASAGTGTISDAMTRETFYDFRDGTISIDEAVATVARRAKELLGGRTPVSENELEARIKRLREALRWLLVNVEHATDGAFRNGVRDPSESIDQGEVWADQAIEQARTVLAEDPQ